LGVGWVTMTGKTKRSYEIRVIVVYNTYFC